MADLIGVPLKKTSDIDLIKPLKNLISSAYSASDNPEDYTEAIVEFHKLRVNAAWRTLEKHVKSLDTLYGYYDQLVSLESKIPSTEVQVPFKWKDAFDKGSLFLGRISLTVSSLAYERVCVLFNIGAMQSQIAAEQNLESDEGLKLAAKLLQQSSGIFGYLKGNVLSAIQQDPTPDMAPETLSALAALMLAQAQEVFVLKAIHDRMKESVIAKLCNQCEDNYAEALRQMQKELVKPLWDREWIPLIAAKQACYHALAEFYQSRVCAASKNIGEEISRLQLALELLKVAQTRCGNASFFQSHRAKIQRYLDDAKKDNDFIYHERVPDVKVLPAMGKAPLAKALPMPDHLSQDSRDVFEKLVPIQVQQALAAYDVRKTEIVNGEIGKLRDATQMLNSFLASLNLPAAIEDVSGVSLPQSVKDKAKAVREAGGVQSINKLISDLPDLLTRNREILDEAERMLTEEKNSDDQLRAQFKEKWTRTPSEKLTDTFKTNSAKYRHILDTAVQADKTVREMFETNRRGMELLSGDERDLEAVIPSSNPTAAIQSSSSVAQLRQLMERVETIKAERDVIESELKSATTDMRSMFLAALAQDGVVSEQSLSVESLGRTYGPLQGQVKDSLAAQEDLVAKIQRANTEFSKEKGNNNAALQREDLLKQLAASYDAFIQLRSNLNEGKKFYNDLTQLLLTFQSKVSDYCFARKTEKDELMKDVTQTLARQESGSAPTPPAHHSTSDSTVGSTRQAPPRPLPPNASPASTTATSPNPYAGAPQQSVLYAGAQQQQPNVPYPVNPQMPQPYGQQPPYAPYTPMPSGYNPYATYPGPHSQGFPGYQPPPYQPYPQQTGQSQPRQPYPSYPYPQQQWR